MGPLGYIMRVQMASSQNMHKVNIMFLRLYLKDPVQPGRFQEQPCHPLIDLFIYPICPGGADLPPRLFFAGTLFKVTSVFTKPTLRITIFRCTKLWHNFILLVFHHFQLIFNGEADLPRPQGLMYLLQPRATRVK